MFGRNRRPRQTPLWKTFKYRNLIRVLNKRYVYYVLDLFKSAVSDTGSRPEARSLWTGNKSDYEIQLLIRFRIVDIG